jgi:hypothetical protein
MLGVTFFGLFLTPVFYVAIMWLVERLQRRPHQQPGATAPPAATPPKPT